MIIEYNRESIHYLDNNLLSKEMIDRELKNNPFGKYILYIKDNELIGYIYYSDIYERAEINEFEIKEIHRNCGIGKELLKKMLALVNKDVTLEVNINNAPAIKVYKDCGFVEKAIRKGYYNGIDGILMEKNSRGR